jgi:hypothetical protein
LGLLLVLGLVMPFIPVATMWASVVGAVALTTISVIAVVQFAVQLTRRPLSRLAIWVAFALTLGLWALLDNIVLPRVGAPLWATLRSGQQPTPDVQLPLIAVRTVVDLSLMSAAVFGGWLLSKLINEPGMIAPICGVIAMIDVWGVLFGGIVAQLLDKAPTVANKAMASLPTMGAASAATREEFFVAPLSVGVGDYLFLGFLFAALHQNGMNWRGAAKWVTPLILFALLGILAGLPHMPGLLFIGLGVAIPNVKFFRFTPEEKIALVWAGVFVFVLTIGLYFAAPYIVKTAQRLEPARDAPPRGAPVENTVGNTAGNVARK